MPPRLLPIALLLVIATTPTLILAATEQETTALQSFYNLMNGDNWTRKDNWNNGGDPCGVSRWFGVYCSTGGSVTGM